MPTASKQIRWITLVTLIGIIGWLWSSNAAKLWTIVTLPDPDMAVAELRAERARLDQTVWAKEEEAQRYEQYFVHVWDDLRNATDKFEVLRNIDPGTLHIGRTTESQDYEAEITRINFTADDNPLGKAEWIALLDRLETDGYRVEQCEFHHRSFHKMSSGSAESIVGTVLHIINVDRHDRIEIHGELHVEWSPGSDSTPIAPVKIDASRLTLLRRQEPPAFEEVFTTAGVAIAGPANWEDLLVADLDSDGRSDLVHLSQNRVFWNRGSFDFEAGELCAFPTDDITGGALADFNGDGILDLLILRRRQGIKPASRDRLLLYAGSESGQFLDEPAAALLAPIELKTPDSCAIGDIDADGDLDLWLTQYKMPYRGGQMPTPYYDANDGWPSYLLLGDGRGNFADATMDAGLTEKRHRRTYRSSFVDLDDDSDLDLLVVSDFAGIDIHRNNGRGQFTDVTETLVDEPSNFGMSHTFADFNTDGKLDFYVAGMASTTARRLDQLGLGREGFDDYQKMRSIIAYGNRMYLSMNASKFEQPSFRDQVARCGWSWGCASLDFDLDGDVDIYVANGHNSGASCKDYCTTFWRHDIYTGGSKDEPLLDLFFTNNLLSDDQTGQGSLRQHLSWNGYEHNRLLMNMSAGNQQPLHASRRFVNVAHLLAVAVEADSRQLAVDDFDLDGRPDLVLGWLDRSHGSAKLVFSVFKNNWPEANHWIGIRLRGAPGISPLGSRITVRTVDQIQTATIVAGDSFASQSAPMKQFGLGQTKQVDSITVRWPNGTIQQIDEPAIDQYHVLRAGS